MFKLYDESTLDAIKNAYTTMMSVILWDVCVGIHPYQHDNLIEPEKINDLSHDHTVICIPLYTCS